MKSTFISGYYNHDDLYALGQPSKRQKERIPDWAFGGFERPQGANPVISPIENTKFYCP